MAAKDASELRGKRLAVGGSFAVNVAPFKVLYELPQGYKMYSNVSIGDENENYYLVLEKEGGKVEVQDHPSHVAKGKYCLSVNTRGQLVRTNEDSKEAFTKGKHMAQSDDYVLTVDDSGHANISDGTNTQKIDLPWV